MTLQEFNQLHENEKTTAVYNLGAYLGERSVEFYNILLYQVDDFYVELFYNESGNEIAHLQSFTEKENAHFLFHHQFPSLN